MQYNSKLLDRKGWDRELIGGDKVKYTNLTTFETETVKVSSVLGAKPTT